MSYHEDKTKVKAPRTVRESNRLVRITSTDAGHSHEYIVDAAGNGIATEVSHADEPNIKHSHKIVKWVVQEEQSDCYPNCEDLYGHEGAPPHSHTISHKNILNRQVSRYSKLLPSIYIDRVTLESSGNPPLRAVVDFCIRETVASGSTNQWLNNAKLKKNLKIKLIQSVDSKLTENLTYNINTANSNDENLEIVSNITIDDTFGNAGDYIENNSYTDESGNSIVNIHFRKTFDIGNKNPKHLSYFVFPYLEVNNNDSQNGYISLEKVIDRGKNVGSTVHDFRYFDTVKNLPIDLAYSNKEELLLQSKIQSLSMDNALPRKKDPYLSEIFLSRDRYNRAKFAFAMDYRKIIKNASIFGNLYESIIEEHSEDMLKLSSISSLTIKRRRIKRINTNNKLESSVGGEHIFDASLPPESILVTQDGVDVVEEINDTEVGIREIPLAARNSQGIRFFVGYDNTIAQLSDGIYQYGVELLVEDKTKEYLEKILISLSGNRKRLYEYYTEGTRVGATKYDAHLDTTSQESSEVDNSSGNYNFNADKFTQKFVNKQRRNFGNWKVPVTNYFEILRLVTGYTSSVTRDGFIEMTNPEKASPKSIMAVISSIDNLISKIDHMINSDKLPSSRNNVNGEAQTHTPSRANKVTKIEYWFTTDDFDASLKSNFGYDYLSNNVNENTINNGIKFITVNNYNKRAAKEISKYYINASDGATNTNWSYLTPSFCYFGSDAENKIFDFSTIVDHGKYANLSANILAHNSDAPTEEIDLSEDKIKLTMASVYSNLNLTVKTANNEDIVKPIETIGTSYSDPEVDPNKLFLSIMKSYSESGLTNDTSTDNPFVKESNLYRIGDQTIDPSEKGIEMWNFENINYIKNNIPSASDVFDNPPIQIKALISDQDGWGGEDPIKNPDISPYFHFKYSMINRIEVLVEFSGSSDFRIKDLKWKPLTRVIQNLRNNDNSENVLLCRMKPFEFSIMGIKQPKGLKLPVYDNYFILEVET